jgi:hypothetical protein
MGHMLSAVDWAYASGSLVTTGSVRLPRALDLAMRQRMMDAAAPPWRALSPEEGVVRQDGYFSHTVVADSEPLVWLLGGEIVEGLRATLGPSQPSIPHFNEVSWTRYPEGTGHITTHRDPTAYGGVVAIATLQGAASFRVWGGDVPGRPSEVLDTGTPPTRWEAAAGDLILLRGNGWPTPKARCPLHDVCAPHDGDRMIMTFRHNTGGAGSGYEV